MLPVTFVPIEIGPALLEVARAYDRRTRLLLAEFAQQEHLSAMQAEGLHEVVFPEYEFGPAPERTSSNIPKDANA